MAQFHPHWYLTTPESLSPIDPRLLVLEPQKNRTRGRAKGAKNKPTSEEELEASTQDTSTHRIASGFEGKAVAGGVPVGEAETAAALKKQLAGRSFQVNLNRR
jgi:hypothetical protein